MSLSCHEEFKKGNVHTNFIPDHMSELFPKEKYFMKDIAFVVLAQIFAEEIKNSGLISVNDPFSTEGPFRLNHCYNKTYKYDFRGKATGTVEVTLMKKGMWNVKCAIENLNTKEKIENCFDLLGSYIQRKEDFIIKHEINGEVSIYVYILIFFSPHLNNYTGQSCIYSHAFLCSQVSRKPFWI